MKDDRKKIFRGTREEYEAYHRAKVVKTLFEIGLGMICGVIFLILFWFRPLGLI